ncbi:Uncharacterized protein OBRU01_22817, partial [Operophtera brumata]
MTGTIIRVQSDKPTACSITSTASEHGADHERIDTNMQTHKPTQRTNSYKNLEETNSKINRQVVHDEIYTEDHDLKNMNLHSINPIEFRHFEENMVMKNRVKRDTGDPRCKAFEYDNSKDYIMHPHNEKEMEGLYYNNTDCTTVITAPEGYVIVLTFVDKFRIEYHSDCSYDYLEVSNTNCSYDYLEVSNTNCSYDYLEIRDGEKGYATLLGRVCGQAFPRVMTTRGPNAWLKFHSDDTIEYEGFKIIVEKKKDINNSIAPECFENLTVATSGTINSKEIKGKCRDSSVNHGLDVLWKISTPPYAKGCEREPRSRCTMEDQHASLCKEHYCGSVANPVTTKADKPGEKGNVMYIRLYTSQSTMNENLTRFEATYTAFRTTDPAKNDECNEKEFDCADNTCIDVGLKCNGVANCRLKTDEDTDVCKEEAGSPIKELHILVILIIFSLILSTMMFVFLFKCIRKLYQDHNIIKPTSIDSDFQETHIDLEEEVWRREVDTQIQPEDILIERNGRTRRRDMSKKEESIRSKRESEERKDIRDVSVGAPDTKESGCQTRESLFQTDPPPSSDGK